MNNICYRCGKEVDRKDIDGFRVIELDNDGLGVVHTNCYDFKTPYLLEGESRPLPKPQRISYNLKEEPPSWGDKNMEKIIPHYMEKEFVRWTPYLRVLETVEYGGPYQKEHKRVWSYGVPGNMLKKCYLAKVNSNVYKQPNFFDVVDSAKNSKPIKVLTYDPCLFYGSHDESIPRVHRFLEVEIEFEDITLSKSSTFVGWTGNQKVSGTIEFDFRDRDMLIASGKFSFQRIWRAMLPPKPKLEIEDLKLILGHNFNSCDVCT